MASSVRSKGAGNPVVQYAVVGIGTQGCAERFAAGLGGACDEAQGKFCVC